jgi:hypothetical protein
MASIPIYRDGLSCGNRFCKLYMVPARNLNCHLDLLRGECVRWRRSLAVFPWCDSWEGGANNNILACVTGVKWLRPLRISW